MSIQKLPSISGAFFLCFLCLLGFEETEEMPFFSAPAARAGAEEWDTATMLVSAAVAARANDSADFRIRATSASLVASALATLRGQGCCTTSLDTWRNHVRHGVTQLKEKGADSLQKC